MLTFHRKHGQLRALAPAAAIALMTAACSSSGGQGAASSPSDSFAAPSDSGGYSSGGNPSDTASPGQGSSPGSLPGDVQQYFQTQTVPSAGADQAFGSGNTGTLTQDEAYNYLKSVLVDTDKMWTAYFESIPGGHEPDFYWDIITDGHPAQSNCYPDTQITADYNNAFFCSADSETDNGVTYNGHIVLPLDTFMKMWNGDIFSRPSQEVGDFAAAVVTAHEVAHSEWYDLQTQFNLPPINQPGQPKDKRNDLIADCGAGVWANSAYYKGYLQGDDVQIGMDALGAIGDTSASTDPHGTPQEREQAFMLGYNTGKPGACVSQYWPGVTGG